ncbi:hypothetical protein E8D34_13985 [Nocardioides sp. GY 10113]|uniref:hypothetical protein n=1 Tax=Nocardioides sp. GY 10113 TaxID=2569761 RepID=UPI0010A8100D|nr:hypothetical protein [Nocardioides sp. GY 10113]TIC84821.1 hypothetical protein E8D34_13985 [Nocardioides sp. GY 10113]
MRAWRARRRPVLPAARGERILAWAPSAGGVVAGSRHALYLPDRLPWEEVAAAEWDDDSGLLRVREVGQWGEPQPVHVRRLEAPALLLQLVRERVSASIVLQRHVAVRGQRGARVIARRAPSSRAAVAWFVEYDEGVEPGDPLVRERVEAALAQARSDLGE